VRNMSNLLSAESGCYRIRPSRPFVNGVMQPYRLLLARRPPLLPLAPSTPNPYHFAACSGLMVLRF
jgi:hypothetical protein